MSLWGDLKQKAIDANPELAAKATQALNKAKDLAVEAGQKAAPVLKEAGEKAAAYAQDELFINEPFNHYGRQFNFFIVTGEVLDTQKRNQLHLHAGHSHSGGGGYISNGSGYVGGGSSSSYVSSRNVEEHEFWVKLPDGKEACFQLADKNVRIREEQTISMLFMHPAETNTGKMVALHNHSSDTCHIICSSAQINSMFNLYTVEPGFFNKNEVLTTRNKLLLELDRRLGQLKALSSCTKALW